MVIFPCSKINLGLNILRRRSDGYHDISSVLVPVGWTDVLEAVPAETENTRLTVSGNPVDCPPEKNLVMKALKAVESHIGHSLPAIDIFLHKTVPDGAGLGGGSADATAMVKMLNRMFALGISSEGMRDICSTIGADCPFFLNDGPMLASGTGTTLTPITIPQLQDTAVSIIKPAGSVSTAEAYAGVKPSDNCEPLEEILRLPIKDWRGKLHNMFEPSVVKKLPEVNIIKEWLYTQGASYAAMSGSGSAVFGLFEGDNLSVDALPPVPDCKIYRGRF